MEESTITLRPLRILAILCFAATAMLFVLGWRASQQSVEEQQWWQKMRDANAEYESPANKQIRETGEAAWKMMGVYMTGRDLSAGERDVLLKFQKIHSDCEALELAVQHRSIAAMDAALELAKKRIHKSRTCYWSALGAAMLGGIAAFVSYSKFRVEFAR